MQIIGKILVVLIPTLVILFSFYFIIPSFKITMDLFVSKLFNSFTEITSKNTWNEVNITNNWRGYEVHQGLIEFSNGNIIEKVFGYGWGKGIDMGEYSFLVVSDRDDTLIPHLHNGYITMLIKFGIFGLILYINFYLKSIYRCIAKIRKGYWNYHLALASLICLLINTMIVKGIFSSSCSGILCFFMVYESYEITNKYKKTLVCTGDLANGVL